MNAAPLVILTMLAAMALVGGIHARRIRSGTDFALAGRSLGAWVLSGTLVATWVGTGSILGNAEFAYNFGLGGFWLPISGLVGMLVLVRIAPRVRAFEAGSVPDMLGMAFGSGARRLGALALIAAYMIIVSYQYRAGSAVAVRIFGELDFGSSSVSAWPVLCALFVVLYTALAGLSSVAATDCIAGIVIVTGILASLAIAWLAWDRVTDPLPAELLRFDGARNFGGWVGVMLPGFLLMLGDANLMQRFLAAKSPAVARRSAWMAFVGLAVIETAVIGLALVGRARLGGDLDNPAHVILVAAFELVPSFVGLGLIAAIVAVVLSTADSFLLAASTAAVGEQANPKRQRLMVLAMGFLALGLAYTSDEFFSVALFAYTIYGVAITPAVLLALFAPGVKPAAVVGGMGAGLLLAVVWQFGGIQLGGLDPVLPALGVNLIVVWVLNRGLPVRVG